MRDDLDYGGFWRRAGALFADMAIVLPFAVIHPWLLRPGEVHTAVSIASQIAIALIYSVYLVYRFGGTPGKLLMGLRVTRVDGTPVTFRQALLRHAPELVFSVIGGVGAAITSSRAGITPSFFPRGEELQFLRDAQPEWLIPVTIATQVWIWSELIVLLTNRRRRAIHDFIAGTVVIRRHRPIAPVSESLPPDGSWRQTTAR